MNVRCATEGTRNCTINSEVWSLARFDNIALQVVLDDLAEACADSGLEASEIERTIASALRARGIGA